MTFDKETIYALATDKSVKPPNSGLYRSYDCKNWELLREFGVLVAKDILIQPANQSKIIYVNGLDSLHVSKNEHTWERIDFTLGAYVNFDILAVDPSNPGTIYFSMIKSIDGGKTWQDIFAPKLFKDVYIADMAIDPYDQNILYAAIYKYGILKT